MGSDISPVTDRQYFSAKTDWSVPASHAYDASLPPCFTVVSVELSESYFDISKCFQSPLRLQPDVPAWRTMSLCHSNAAAIEVNAMEAPKFRFQ
ncbi:hypothetical protein BLNAU_14860 [Blattamonas nauphoetae]|uniref:Uncharacterized protein n=1 Tax=Blattamonas nauphoetae TaxID=2049346 RepID=A0ABQ9XFH6_9EUKA|nr:hypothetical protein BLNAU_14860 [Blattamonas nauphoetae]